MSVKKGGEPQAIAGYPFGDSVTRPREGRIHCPFMFGSARHS
jgi:hypothetical protein